MLHGKPQYNPEIKVGKFVRLSTPAFLILGFIKKMAVFLDYFSLLVYHTIFFYGAEEHTLEGWIWHPDLTLPSPDLNNCSHCDPLTLLLRPPNM